MLAPADRGRSVAAARLLALLLPAALLGGAIGSQVFGGLHPCEMCLWQRWPHASAILFAAAAYLFPASDRRTRILVLLAALAIAVSGAIGVYHAGVEMKWWQGLTECTANGAHSLQEILATPLIRCDQVQFSFLGISMAGWNAILSLGGALSIVWLAGRGRRA